MKQDQNLDKLAAKFFQLFSRTEYAMKVAGYNNGNGPAEANWQKLALDVEDLIANPTSPNLREAIDFIFKAPPKKQMIINGLIQWENVKPDTSSRADKLLQYVCRVRNNLFHGGKFNGRWFEPERSESLLQHSLIILSAVIEAIPAVKEAFNS